MKVFSRVRETLISISKQTRNFSFIVLLFPGTGRLDDFYSFDFETRMWEEVQVLSAEKPGCRENNGVVISDSSDSIYLFGGETAI